MRNPISDYEKYTYLEESYIKNEDEV